MVSSSIEIKLCTNSVSNAFLTYVVGFDNQVQVFSEEGPLKIKGFCLYFVNLSSLQKLQLAHGLLSLSRPRHLKPNTLTRGFSLQHTKITGQDISANIVLN